MVYICTNETKWIKHYAPLLRFFNIKKMRKKTSSLKMIFLNHSVRQIISIKREREQCPLYILLPQVKLCRRNSMAYLTLVTAGIIRHEDVNQIIILLSFWNVIWKKGNAMSRKKGLVCGDREGHSLKSIDKNNGLIFFYIM